MQWSQLYTTPSGCLMKSDLLPGGFVDGSSMDGWMDGWALWVHL